MSSPWHSLYLKVSEPDDHTAIITALRQALQAHGYEPYDPFSGGSGTPPKFKTFIKQFVALPQAGWSRVLGDPDPAALMTLSETQPMLYGWLSDAGGGWQVISGGVASADLAAFAPYLKPGKTLDDLKRAQAGHAPVATVEPNSTLPPDVQQLARDHHVNTEQADKMMARVTTRLFGKLDRGTGGEAGAMQQQARALISSSQLDWNSSTGRVVRAVADVLVLPDPWRVPDWVDLRDAYQAARMLARNPKASLLPDERDALKAIPNALSYMPVYVGKL